MQSKLQLFTGNGAMLAPIRLGNATASLQLRCQPRRKETHPHHPSAPLPPLRGSSLTARTSRDPAHNSFATQNFFCSGREISQCDHVGLLLIFTHNQRKPHLFLCCYPESSTDAVPAYIDLYPYSSRTHKTRYLQSI